MLSWQPVRVRQILTVDKGCVYNFALPVELFSLLFCFCPQLLWWLYAHFRYSVGDVNVPLCLQSMSKPLTYTMALDELSPEVVHEYVGQEPSGVSFNKIALDYRGIHIAIFDITWVAILYWKYQTHWINPYNNSVFKIRPRMHCNVIYFNYINKLCIAWEHLPATCECIEIGGLNCPVITSENKNTCPLYTYVTPIL